MVDVMGMLRGSSKVDRVAGVTDAVVTGPEYGTSDSVAKPDTSVKDEVEVLTSLTFPKVPGGVWVMEAHEKTSRPSYTYGLGGRYYAPSESETCDSRIVLKIPDSTTKTGWKTFPAYADTSWSLNKLQRKIDSNYEYYLKYVRKMEEENKELARAALVRERFNNNGFV